MRCENKWRFTNGKLWIEDKNIILQCKHDAANKIEAHVHPARVSQRRIFKHNPVLGRFTVQKKQAKEKVAGEKHVKIAKLAGEKHVKIATNFHKRFPVLLKHKVRSNPMLGRFSVQKEIKKEKSSAMKNAKIGFPASRPHISVGLENKGRPISMPNRFSVHKGSKTEKVAITKNAKIGPNAQTQVFVELKHDNRHIAPLGVSGVEEKKKEKVVADKPTKSVITSAYPRTSVESQQKNSLNPILGKFSSDKDKKKETTAEQKNLKTVKSASTHISVEIKHNDMPCFEFDLSSLGGALHFQKSRLGKYILQDDLVNGRITYFNQEKKQYLFWISKNDGYWMVRNP